MDLKELLYRQKVAQCHAANALTVTGRQRYLDRIEGYTARIFRLRSAASAAVGLAKPKPS